jgi:hypothetical protein
MTYFEKLKDPRWQRKRLELLEAANWQCQHCSAASKTMHVHHNFYRSKADPWDYPNHAFAALCEDCHQAAEVDRKELKECIESIYDAEFPLFNLHAAIGLLRGLRMFNKIGVNPDHCEQMTSSAQAWGVARVFGGDERDLLEVIKNKNGVVEHHDVAGLWVYQQERHRNRLEARIREIKERIATREAEELNSIDLSDVTFLPEDRLEKLLTQLEAVT